MDILRDVLFVLFATLACSWGWGMRGTTIGGEKGAMLPGALLGLSIAVFSASDVLYENFFLLSGMGAVAMYCGGNMTYGETFRFSMESRPAPNMKKGMLALFVKGGIWFGVFSAVIGLYISFLSGLYYSLFDIIALFLLIPSFSLLGYYIFNKPYNKEKGTFPRVYFSVTRKETWGGLLGILCAFVAVAAVNLDVFTLIVATAGVLSGGIGWMIAQFMQVSVKYENRRGKFLFDRLRRKGFIESWKLMECTLGAFGGLGVSLCIVLCKSMFVTRLDAIEAGGLFSFVSQDVSTAMAAAFALLLTLDTALYFIKSRPTKAELDRKLELTLISHEDYERELPFATGEDTNPLVTKIRAAAEKAEFGLYSTLPMMLMLLGSTQTAALVSFCVILLVEAQEQCFKNYKFFKKLYLWKIVLLGGALAAAILQFVAGAVPNLPVTMLLYTVVYEALELIEVRWRNIHPVGNGARLKMPPCAKGVHGYFITCCAVLLVITAIIVVA